MQIWGLQWNMLHGRIPDSWGNLRAKSIWVRPGNYQLCGSKPANATFELCKEIDGKCEPPLLACWIIHSQTIQLSELGIRLVEHHFPDYCGSLEVPILRMLICV